MYKTFIYKRMYKYFTEVLSLLKFHLLHFFVSLSIIEDTLSSSNSMKVTSLDSLCSFCFDTRKALERSMLKWHNHFGKRLGNFSKK